MSTVVKFEESSRPRLNDASIESTYYLGKTLGRYLELQLRFQLRPRGAGKGSDFRRVEVTVEDSLQCLCTSPRLHAAITAILKRKI